MSAREFRSSCPLAFGKQFWWYTVASLLQFTGHSVLRNEVLSSSRPSSFSAGSPHDFSFASSSGSKSQLYVAWFSGKLTKVVLGDYGGTTAASKFCAGLGPFVFFHKFTAGIFWLLWSFVRAPGGFAIEKRCLGWLRCYSWCELGFGSHQATELGWCEFCSNTCGRLIDPGRSNTRCGSK